MRRASPERARTPRQLTQAQYARHRKALGLPGGTREAVRRALLERRIDRLPNRRIDPRAADAAWAERSVPKVESPEAGEGLAASLRLISTRSDRELVRKRLDEFRLAQALRETVRAAEILDAATDCSRIARERLIGLARRLGPILAACTDPRECTAILEQEIAAVCAVLAKPIEMIPGGHEATTYVGGGPGPDRAPALPAPVPALCGRSGR